MGGLTNSGVQRIGRGRAETDVAFPCAALLLAFRACMWSGRIRHGAMAKNPKQRLVQAKRMHMRQGLRYLPARPSEDNLKDLPAP